jgi:acyl dehydratase
VRRRWYEDYEVGEAFISNGKTLTETEIIDFAFRYDPQPFHIDSQAAAGHMYGGLIASGWHVVSVAFRLFMDTRPWGDAGLGSPGCDELRWIAPVRPGDTIRTEVIITDMRESRSQADRGLLMLDWAILNQEGNTVMTMKSVQLTRRKSGNEES